MAKIGTGYPPKEDRRQVGIGIESGKLQSVFESFTQIDNTYTRQQTGTGLISKPIDRDQMSDILDKYLPAENEKYETINVDHDPEPSSLDPSSSHPSSSRPSSYLDPCYASFEHLNLWQAAQLRSPEQL